MSNIAIFNDNSEKNSYRIFCSLKLGFILNIMYYFRYYYSYYYYSIISQIGNNFDGSIKILVTSVPTGHVKIFLYFSFF